MGSIPISFLFLIVRVNEAQKDLGTFIVWWARCSGTIADGSGRPQWRVTPWWLAYFAQATMSSIRTSLQRIFFSWWNNPVRTLLELIFKCFSFSSSVLCFWPSLCLPFGLWMFRNWFFNLCGTEKNQDLRAAIRKFVDYWESCDIRVALAFLFDP